MGSDSFDPASLLGARTRIKDSSSECCGEMGRVSLATGIGERLFPFGEENTPDARFGWAVRAGAAGGERDRALSEDFGWTVVVGGERWWEYEDGEVGAGPAREICNGLRVGDCVGDDGGDKEPLDGALTFVETLLIAWPNDGDVAVR